MATDEGGRKVWQRNLDTRGNPLQKTDNFVPFLYQGQYFDDETGLAYNRFRYYSPSEGTFISQDPIGLEGGNPNLYGYVEDTNTWIDPAGLSGITHLHHTIPREVYNPRSGKSALLPEHLTNDPDIIGKKGNPNRWAIPADEHIDLHKKNRVGGDYNTRWKQELDKLSKKKNIDDWNKKDILKIRDKLTKEFDIDKYKPSCY